MSDRLDPHVAPRLLFLFINFQSTSIRRTQNRDRTRLLIQTGFRPVTFVAVLIVGVTRTVQFQGKFLALIERF